ncbi:hypothetical protein [Actinokineospora diospyrosa]|uniref:hypothetical protein n=1 Tax=Actinokineospora diospyrosa TaxID=103728 RepID=UPI0020A4337B|nr:hypothetical protein [Actinokineospora diospyrosa]
MRFLLVGCLIALSSCAVPVVGAPVAVDTPVVAADSPEARWVNRFCGMGKLLVTAGETAQEPITAADPAVLKRQFLDVTGRLVGVLDAALADLRALRPAPAPEVDPLIRDLIESFTEARGAIATARDEVRAATPLTTEVLTSAVQRFGGAVSALDRAARLIKAADLPPSLANATDAAPNCR